MALKWFGPKVKLSVLQASIKGVNLTMAEAVIQFKNNHPGWINDTSKAEGSVQILEGAKRVGSAVQGIWGSTGVNYMIWLELNHGGAMRNAATVTYPNLARNIRSFL